MHLHGPTIFGIGLNKTGTTTLHHAVELLGLRSLHHGERIDRSIRRALTKGAPPFRYCRPRVRMADAIFDIRVIQERFVAIDARISDAKFILSTRDVDDWLDSLERHRSVRGRTFDREHERRRFVEHHDAVDAYFGDGDNLLRIDVTSGDGWELLAPFLDRSVPAVPFPHLNQTA